MPWMVAGRVLVHSRTSNWRPYWGWLVQRPRSRRLSPGCAPPSTPTTVTSSADRAVATRATV